MTTLTTEEKVAQLAKIAEGFYVNAIASPNSELAELLLDTAASLEKEISKTVTDSRSAAIALATTATILAAAGAMEYNASVMKMGISLNIAAHLLFSKDK